ncbi:MAG: hypothetical protein EA404_08620 [Spirochaetaceae bacterium]|nr:MAG: hypothetical protein EA404_08620 [Spirochaetaceae bacterium]
MKADTVRSAVALLLSAVAIGAAVPAGAQSIEVRDGANAVGFGLYGEFSSADQFELNGYTAFSIAGIMDIGGYLGRQTQTVNGVQGDNMTIGFLYNLVPVRQRRGFPLTLQLNLSWGLTLVNRDLVVAELSDRFDPGDDIDADSVDGTRSGYSVGAGVSREFELSGPLWARIGADVQFRSERSTYSAVFTFTGDEDTSVPESVGFRETTLLYAPSVALIVRLPDGPLVTVGSRFWFDEDQELVVRPELNLIMLHYQ